jgi:hypothetical protein
VDRLNTAVNDRAQVRADQFDGQVPGLGLGQTQQIIESRWVLAVIEARYECCSAGVRASISPSNTEAVLATTASGLRSSWVTRARNSSLVRASTAAVPRDHG